MATPNNTQIFQMISVFSWLLLIATSLASFGIPKTKVYLDNYSKSFWLTISTTIGGTSPYYLYPNIMYFYIYYAYFILLAAFFISSLCLIVYQIYVKKDSGVDGLFDNISQFHFVPLLCTSALYIIGEICGGEEQYKTIILVFNFIFTVIALGSLLFIHFKTTSLSKIPNILIKQITFGFLLALLVYYFFYEIFLLGLRNIYDNYDDLKTIDKLTDFSKNCSIAFSILIGLANLGISFGLKNAAVSIANLLIYIGMTIWFFKIPENIRDILNGITEGIIDIVMMVLSLCTISFLCYRYREQILG